LTGQKLRSASLSFVAQPEWAKSSIGFASAIGSCGRGRCLVAISPLCSFCGDIKELLFGNPR
jgi:hypothetical protein